MPWSFLGPAIGAIAGAFGGSGKQGGSKGTTNQTTANQGQTNQVTGQKYNGTRNDLTTSIEDPLFQMGRYGLINTLGGEINRAQNTPIFGAAQQAQMLDTLNETSQNAFNRLKSNLASAGSLDSGRLGQGATDIELGRSGDISRFYRDLPFREEQARQARLNPLLETAAQFLGRPTPGQATTGEVAGTTTGQSQTNTQNQGQTQGQTSTTNENAPWWKILLANLGGEFAMPNSPFNTGLADLFKANKPKFEPNNAQITTGPQNPWIMR